MRDKGCGLIGSEDKEPSMFFVEHVLRRNAQGWLGFFGNRCVAFIIGVAAASLAGCGGGGSSGSSVTATEDTDSGAVELVSLEGRVTAPGGVVAQFRAPSLLQYAAEFFLPSATAQIMGLDVVKDAEVNLVRVNDKGELQGNVLATAKTGVDGRFEMSLGNALLASGDLMLQVVGQNNSVLRAPVVSHSVDVDPLSEFVISKLLESEASLASVNIERLASLMAALRKGEFDFSGPTLASVEEELKEKLNDVVTVNVAAATTQPGSDSDTIGVFNSARIGFGFEDYAPDYTAADFDIAYTALTDLEVSSLGAGNTQTLLRGQRSAMTTVPVAGPDRRGPSYIEDNRNFDIKINGFFGYDFVARALLPPQKNSYLSPEGQMIIATSPPGYFVKQISTDGSVLVSNWRNREDRDYEGPNGTFMPHGKTLERYLEVMVREPKDAALEDVVVTYGLASFDTSASDPDSYSISSELTTLDIRSDGSARFEKISPTGGPESDPTLSVEVDKEGAVTLEQNQEKTKWIVNDTFSVIAGGSVTGDKTPFFSETMFSLGVRLPEPDDSFALAGRRYRLIHLAVNGDASSDFERRNVRSVETVDFDTFLEFENNESARVSGLLELVGLPKEPEEPGQLKIQTEKRVLSNEQAEVELGDNGRLKITYQTSESIRVLDGFINSGGSMAVLRISEAPEIEGGKAVLGLTVLLEVLARE